MKQAIVKDVSDKRYLSKREIEQEFGRNNFFLLMTLVDDYRKLIQIETSLPANITDVFKISLTPTLFSQVSAIEKKIIDYWRTIENTDFIKLAQKRIIELAQIKIKDIDKLDEKLLQPAPELTTLSAPFFAYYNALIQFHDIDKEYILFLFSQFDCQQEIMYREDSPLDQATLDAGVKALVDFYKSSTFSPMLTTIIGYSYFLYLSPFDHSNEYIAHILASQYLYSFFKKNIPIQLPQFAEERLAEIIKDCHQEQDLTYLLYFLVDFVYNDFVELDEEIEVSATMPSTKTSPTLPYPESFAEDHFISKVTALYPQLKQMHAQFLFKHYQKDHFYKIVDFKNELGVSYETARTAMELLTVIGYYRKEKYKNKFVYCR